MTKYVEITYEMVERKAKIGEFVVIVAPEENIAYPYTYEVGDRFFVVGYTGRDVLTVEGYRLSNSEYMVLVPKQIREYVK